MGRRPILDTTVLIDYERVALDQAALDAEELAIAAKASESTGPASIWRVRRTGRPREPSVATCLTLTDVDPAAKRDTCSGYAY